MSADNKLRAVVVLRLDDGGSTTIVAKLDYAQHDSSSSTTSDDLYGNENDFAKAVQNAVSNDSPTAGLSGKIGGFKVVQSEMHQVTYGADTLGLCCAVITGIRYSSRVATAFLEELYNEWNPRFGNDAKTAPANSLTRTSKHLLQGICKKYSDPGNVDKSFKVMASVEGVKGQVGENIAGILEGQQKAEQLIAKTNEITEQSEIFVTRSGDLKNQMKWKNRKMTLILVALVVGITLAIVVPLIIKARNASSK